MMLYALICLSLSLTGIAGFQLAYMFYLDRLDQERKKRIRELEVQCRSLTRQLKEAEAQLEEQNDLLDEYLPDRDDEMWADVLDDR